MSSAQLRATKRYRERRRKRGLSRVEVQVPVRETAVIRRAAAVLRGPADQVERLRAHLGFDQGRGAVPTAVNMFAMDEPLSPDAEAQWEEAMATVARDRKDPSLNRARKVDL